MKINFSLTCVLIAVCLTIPDRVSARPVFELDTTAGETHFSFHLVNSSDATCRNAVDAALTEYARISRLFSEDHKNSEISRINVNAGFQPVKVPNEVFNLVYRSLKLAVLTNGAFDVTTGLLVKHYNRYSGHSAAGDSILTYLLDRTGHEKIELNMADRTIFLSQQGMMISLKEMVTGYAMNRMVEQVKELGINSGYLMIDLQKMCWGTPPGKKDWVLSVPDPFKESDNLKMLKMSNLAMFSVVVVQKRSAVKDAQHCLCIHPKTGVPVKEVKGVTIICPDAEVADAIATSVAILGVEQGMKLIDLLEGVDGVIVDHSGEAHYSKNFQQLVVPWVNH